MIDINVELKKEKVDIHIGDILVTDLGKLLLVSTDGWNHYCFLELSSRCISIETSDVGKIAIQDEDYIILGEPLAGTSHKIERVIPESNVHIQIDAKLF